MLSWRILITAFGALVGWIVGAILVALVISLLGGYGAIAGAADLILGLAAAFGAGRFAYRVAQRREERWDASDGMSDWDVEHDVPEPTVGYAPVGDGYSDDRQPAGYDYAAPPRGGSHRR